MGIFPWPQARTLAWFSPDPRMVLWPHRELVSRSLRKVVERGPFELRINSAFEQVIEACARVPRPGQPGTWINRSVRDCYLALHNAGLAHSFEAWRDGQLVGGLYGVSVGASFAGESMFHRETDASKFAFIGMARHLWQHGYQMVDCQMHTDHLASLGAVEVDRTVFIEALRDALRAPPSWPVR